NMATGNHTHTAAQVGLGNVANFGYSNAIGDNSVERYATTNMVAQVRAEKVSKGGDTMTGTLVLSGASQLHFTPTNGISMIDFKNTGTNNDRGWIKHKNSSTTASMEFVVSDDPSAGSDFFTFGAATGNASADGTYSEWVKINPTNIYYKNNAVYHAGNKPNSTDVGLGNVGNYSAVNKAGDTMTGALGIAAGAAQLATSTPTQLSYGLLGSYGTLRILANTDNSGSEPVLIASAQGLTTDVNSGLAVYPTWMNFRGNSVYHAGAEATRTCQGSWLSGRDNAVINLVCGDSSYGSAVRSRGSSHTFAMGVLGNGQFGFYRYLNSRTTNGTDSQFYIDTAGNATCSGNITAYSDIKLKSNLTIIGDALLKINELNGYTFNKIGSEDRQTGVIAQEVQKVLPEAIVVAKANKGDEDQTDTLSVAYGNMVGLLIEGIKELKREIDELKSQLNK
ncbi:MAG: tail fiber domain-containing protein, partial [Fusobacteriaceae bacterium]